MVNDIAPVSVLLCGVLGLAILSFAILRIAILEGRLCDERQQPTPTAQHPHEEPQPSSQELAAEAVRRAEWALGRAIRKGQADGTIAKQGAAPDFSLGEVQKVTTYGTTGELYARDGKPGILTIADAAPEPEQFDAALNAAKAEGNLSRANVARKAREASGATPRATPRRSLPDVARDTGWDLRKAVERLSGSPNRPRYPKAGGGSVLRRYLEG